MELSHQLCIVCFWTGLLCSNWLCRTEELDEAQTKLWPSYLASGVDYISIKKYKYCDFFWGGDLLLLYFGVERIRGIRGVKLPSTRQLCGLRSALCATAARKHAYEHLEGRLACSAKNSPH